MLKSEPNKLNDSFYKVELTAFAQGHFSVIYDRANGDFRLNMMASPCRLCPTKGSSAAVAAAGRRSTNSRFG